MATLSLVPTPSALETSTGSFHFFWSRANSAPNPPMPPSTPGVKVRLAWCRILCFAASARGIFPPASVYFMEVFVCSVFGSGVQHLRVVRFLENSCLPPRGVRHLLYGQYWIYLTSI